MGDDLASVVCKFGVGDAGSACRVGDGGEELKWVGSGMRMRTVVELWGQRQTK